MSLLLSRRFGPLFFAQFLAAFGDNLLRATLISLAVFGAAALPEGSSGMIVMLASATFVAPFILLSGLGGELADKFDKAKLARLVKLAEVFVVIGAAFAFVMHSIPGLFVALFLSGVLSALFGPVKFAILPDVLTRGELSAGNAWIEAGTFIAILLGIVVGNTIAVRMDPVAVGAILVLVAAGSWAVSLLIPSVRPADPTLEVQRNVVKSTRDIFVDIMGDKRLVMGVALASWFWLVGAVAMNLLPPLTRDVLKGDELLASALQSVFVFGIAAGSLVAARLGELRPNLALVAVGVVGLALFGVTTALAFLAFGAGGPQSVGSLPTSLSGWLLMLSLMLLSASGGLFIVPIFAEVQAIAPEHARARVVAAVNVGSAIFVAGGTALVAVLQAIGMTDLLIFAAIPVVGLSALWCLWEGFGQRVLKDLTLSYFLIAHDLKVEGVEHLQAAGPRKVVVPNHVSMADGPLMFAVIEEDISFGVETLVATQWPITKRLLAFARHAPMDPFHPFSIRKLIGDAREGRTVVIFPEGRISVHGGLMKVHDGPALIAARAEAKLVPTRIEGLAETSFSYVPDDETAKRAFAPVRVRFFPAIDPPAPEPGATSAARRASVADALKAVMIETGFKAAVIDETLAQAIARAREERCRGSSVLRDTSGDRVTYKKLEARVAALAPRLAGLAPEGAGVAVLLPNRVAGVVALLALVQAGRVPLILPPQLDPEAAKTALKAAGVTALLASRAFVERARLGALVEALSGVATVTWLEDLPKDGGIAPTVLRQPNDPAVMLVTSAASPGVVVLSHRNILANARQFLAQMDANGRDRILATLPLGHAMGLMGGVVLPLLAGIPVTLHDQPAAAKAIANTVYGANLTVLFGTDSLLKRYAEVADPYDFRALRLVFAGDEPVSESTRRLYADQFGVRILEGYGMAAAGPIVAVNTPIANRPGTVGRAVPGLETRLDADGRLHIRGPNVMLGEYRADAPGVLKAPPEGWHDTGDRVAIDADGYLTLLGRAA